MARRSKARRSNPKGFAEPKTPYAAPRSGGKWANEIARGKRALPVPETLPTGTIRYFLVLGPKGRVLLPADMRAASAPHPLKAQSPRPH